jgi:hypothetical protein
MKTRIFYFCVMIVLIIAALVIGTNIGVAEGQDGRWYVSVAALFFNKNFIPIGPFETNTPRLWFPPVFGGISLPIIYDLPAPYPMIVWVLFMFLLLGLSAICIGTITRDVIGKKYEVLACLIFLLLPFQFVYATTFWSETFCIFLISVYLRLFVSILRNKSPLWPSTLVFWASLMTLTKVNFILLLVLSLIVWIVLTWKRNFYDEFWKLLVISIPAWIGLGGIVKWTLFVSQYTGRLQFTNNSAINLWVSMTEANILPSANSPAYIEMLKWTTKDSWFRPYWIFMNQFIPGFNKKQLTLMDIYGLMENFAKTAIIEHPVKYIIHIFHNSLLLPITNPIVWDIIADYKRSCQVIWGGYLCRPIYDNPQLMNVWFTYIAGLNGLYPYVMLVIYGIAVVGIVSSFLNRNKYMMIFAILFVIMLLEHSFVLYGRYFIVMYPLYTLFLTMGFITIYRGIVKIRKTYFIT